MKSHSPAKELWKRLRHHGLGHWLTVLVLTAAGFAFGHYIDDHNLWTDIRYAASQKLQNLFRSLRGSLYPKRTAIVLVDDDDYWKGELEGRSPIRRDYLARLVDALDKAGADVIALDFDLRSPVPDGSVREITAYLEETKTLAKSINAVVAHRPVVLSTSVGFARDSDGYVEEANVYDTLVSPAVARGYVQLPYDVRRVPLPLEAYNLVTHQTVNVESLATAIVKCVDQVAYNRTVQHGSDELPFAGYIAPEEFAAPPATERKLLSASDLLKDPEAAHKYLGGRIIIVSGNWSSRAFGVGPRVDLHASPIGPVPGAMIHANYVEAMLNDRAFSPVAEWFVVIVELLAVLLLAIVMALHLSAWAEAATVVGATLFFLVANFFLQDLGRFFDFFVPLVILLGHVAAGKIIGWRKAARKQQAHGHAA